MSTIVYLFSSVWSLWYNQQAKIVIHQQTSFMDIGKNKCSVSHRSLDLDWWKTGYNKSIYNNFCLLSQIRFCYRTLFNHILIFIVIFLYSYYQLWRTFALYSSEAQYFFHSSFQSVSMRERYFLKLLTSLLASALWFCPCSGSLNLLILLLEIWSGFSIL